MKKNIIIVLLAISVLGLGGFLVYDKVLKEEKIVEKENEEDKNKTKKIEKLDDSKDYYYYETTEQFGELVCANEAPEHYGDNYVNEYYENIDFFTNNAMLEFKYPVININSEAAKKLI